MDAKFMRRAIELSMENVQSNRGGPFGAVVVKNGNVIGEGANQVLTTNDPSAHAEVVAIREACRKLNSFQLAGCEIYSSCEPCPRCMGLIYWARPDHLYYANTAADAASVGFDDAFIYRELAIPPENRSLKMKQMMRDEALIAFVAWDKKPDKIRY
ncbi:MAG TPA: nucleoside deaminase [Terriglobales bacterium]|nr:nucleoside deaminase [Terriglobales bacterium]